MNPITAAKRSLEIRRILGRGIYGEAMRELRRLEAATDSELGAELAAIRRSS